MDQSPMHQAAMHAANEPLEGAPNSRFLTPINRDNIAAKIKTVVMTELGAYYPLPQSLVNAHIGIRHNPALAPNGKIWPKSLFIPLEAAINLLSQIMQKRLGSFQSIDSQSPEGLDALITVPSMCCCLVPWSKLGTVIHSGGSIKFADELLNTPTEILKDLPQWSLFIDVTERDLHWNGRKVAGIFYARYALSHPPAQVQAVEPNGDQFLIDNLITIVLFENGSLDLGPFVTLNEGKTVAQSIDDTRARLEDNQGNVIGTGNLSKDQINFMIEGTIANSQQLLLPLLYLMANLDKLADHNGRKQPLTPNPEAYVIGSGLALPDADLIREYYLK